AVVEGDDRQTVPRGVGQVWQLRLGVKPFPRSKLGNMAHQRPQRPPPLVPLLPIAVSVLLAAKAIHGGNLVHSVPRYKVVTLKLDGLLCPCTGAGEADFLPTRQGRLPPAQEP